MAPFVAAYGIPELTILNQRFTLGFTRKNIQDIAAILATAQQRMASADVDNPDFIISQPIVPIVLKVRREGILLQVSTLGEGSYKVAKATLKLAKIVYGNQQISPPTLANIKVESTFHTFPQTDIEMEEMQNEFQINQKLYIQTKEAEKRGDFSYSHIVRCKRFTYVSTGERGFRSIRADGTLLTGNASFSDRGRIQATMGCCRAIDQLHRLGIIHRDIKADNFLYWKDEEGNIVAKITDMGKAVDTNSANPLNWNCKIWALKYIVPDMLKNQDDWKTDPRRDYYALGIMLLELFSGKTFETGDNVYQTLTHQTSFIHSPTSWELVPPAIQPTIRALLAHTSYFYHSSRLTSAQHNHSPITAAEAYQQLEKILPFSSASDSSIHSSKISCSAYKAMEVISSSSSSST